MPEEPKTYKAKVKCKNCLKIHDEVNVPYGISLFDFQESTLCSNCGLYLSGLPNEEESAKIDIDRISTGVSASERSHIITVKEIIDELREKIGKTIPIDDVVVAAKEKGIEEKKLEEVLEKLRRIGDIFTPRDGFISRIE